MRGPAASCAYFALFSASVWLVLQCSPEELVYAPSGPADGSAGDGSMGGTAGSGNWAEVCGNGIDDDSNGKTDCDDPSCENYACVDPAPVGWSGPVALFTGPAGSLPDCPAGLTEVYTGGADPSFEGSGCTGCSCGSPSGESCSVSVTYYQSATCTIYSSGATVSSGCSAAFTGTVGSVQVSASATGNCDPGPTPTPTLGAAAFAIDARACGLATGTPASCEAGGICAPASAQAVACIYQTGEASCPPAFPTRQVFYDSLNDSRGCAACGCSFDATGCSVSLTGYSDTGCTLPVLTAAEGCFAGNVHALVLDSQNVSGETCTSTGSNPTGCVSGDGPTTFCCADPNPCPSGGGPSMVRIPDPAGGSYCIDSTEVTRAQYVTFLAYNPPTTGQIPECSWNTDLEPNNWNPTTADDRPVVGVDWCDAYAFCAWAGKRLCGKIGGGAADPASADDPSVSQWFNACSRGGTRQYAYGDKWTSGACGWSGDDVQSHPCCVGGYPGIYDLSGGVEEWVDSCDGSTDENDGCLTRGPSACDNTDVDDRDQDSSNVGFRCCGP